MLENDEQMSLVQIGVVRSPVLERRDMPAHGVRAEVEIFSAYEDGLLLIEGNTHLWIIGWYTGAERDQLQIVRPEYRSGQRRRGVFGLRSTTRPNSLGICASKLIDVRGRTLVLDHLDFIDGTPVVDIRRYSPSWDAVFPARSSREVMVEVEEAARLDILEMDASTFYDAVTPGVVAIARLMHHIILAWQVLPRDHELRVSIPSAGGSREYIDALQGITAVSFGSGRLQIHEGEDFILSWQDRKLSATPRMPASIAISDARNAALGDLFDLREGM